MQVRAKFFVEDIKHSDIPGTDQYASISMRPVFGTYADGDAEGTNKSWSKWTPSGHLQITITNPGAIDAFEMGKAYYLDFTPVEWMCDEMKERVALALTGADANVKGEVPDYPELADAVFDAMTEPTDAMLVTAFNLGSDATPRDIWRAMIESARA